MFKNRLSRAVYLSLISFFALFTQLALSCEYCASEHQQCDTYQDVCTSYVNQCVSYHQECTDYEDVCTNYDYVCNGYDYVCNAYDDNGDCIDYSYQCTGYSYECTNYTSQCVSYQDVCDYYQQVCTQYTSECTHYTTVCDSYYYGDYLTVHGSIYNTNTNVYIEGGNVSLSASGAGSTSDSTDGNGAYSNSLFVYDDAYGYLNATVCAQLDSSDQQCRNVSVYDSCNQPNVSEDFGLNVTALRPPYNISTTSTSSSSVTVTWNNGGGLTTGYYVAIVPGNTPTSCYDSLYGIDVGSSTGYTFTGLSAFTQYSISLCSHDSYGNPSTRVVAFQTTKHPNPPAPTNLTFSNVTTSGLTASWTSGGGSTIGFYLNYAVGTSAPNCLSGQNLGSATSKTLTGLDSHTTYTISVCAYDAYDDYSSQLSGSKLTLSLPAPPPTNLTVSSDSFSQLTARWNSAGGSTAGFKAAIAAGSVAPNCNSGVDVGDTRSKAFTGLQPFTQYTVAVCSYNYEVVLSNSVTASQTTKRLPPPAPTGMAVSAVGTDKFTVSWVSGGGSTTGFNLSYAAGNTAPDCSTAPDLGLVTSKVLTGLQPHITYSFSLCSNDGFGDYSTPVSGSQLTLSLPAPVPTNLSFSGLTKTSLNANWASGGGSTSGFIAKIAAGNLPSLTCSGGTDVGNVLTKAFSSLTANTLYTVAVCAYNFEKVPSGSIVNTVQTLQDPPPAPTGLTVGTPTPTGLTATWVSGGGNTAGYMLNIAAGAISNMSCAGGTDVGNVLTKALTGLSSNTQYTIAVCAYNSPQRQTSNSISASGKTQFALANPVTNLIVSGQSANSLTASWVSGGGGTSGYRVAIAAGTTAPACSSGTDVKAVTSYTFSGLTTSTSYMISVCAYNGDAKVAAAVSVAGQTYAATPPAPKSLVVTPVSQSQINLSWVSGGGTTTGYKVVYAAGATAPQCSAAGTDNHAATTLSLTSLSAKTQYSVAVCAYNVNGVLSPSVTGTATTFEVPPPAPTNLVLTTNGLSQITASWTSNGGTTKSFIVAYAQGTTAPACTGGKNVGSSVSTLLTNLKPQTSYAISVCAANANGLLSSALTGTKITQAYRLAINSGGKVAGSYIADDFFLGGLKDSIVASVDLSKVTNPAPMNVYQTARYGTMTYTITNLAPGVAYNVRIHMAEIRWNAVNKRLFNITANGATMVSNYDIYKSAGGKKIAVTTSFKATANASGTIVIGFVKSKDNPMLGGIEFTSP